MRKELLLPLRISAGTLIVYVLIYGVSFNNFHLALVIFSFLASVVYLIKGVSRRFARLAENLILVSFCSSLLFQGETISLFYENVVTIIFPSLNEVPEEANVNSFFSSYTSNQVPFDLAAIITQFIALITAVFVTGVSLVKLRKRGN